MVYMAHSDGSHGQSNVNAENYSSQCCSLTIIGLEMWERSVRWWFGGRRVLYRCIKRVIISFSSRVKQIGNN